MAPHNTNSYTYSHLNPNFLQYTIQILVPHVMWSAHVVRDSKIDQFNAIYPLCAEPEARNSAVGWHWNTHVRHKTESRDEMRWSPYIEGLPLARMPAYQAWRTIAGADQMKWNETKSIRCKVKVSPLQTMKVHRGCGCKGPHIHSHSTRKRQDG